MDSCNIEDTLSSLRMLKAKMDFYKSKKAMLSTSIASYMTDIQVLSDRKRMIDSAKQYYLKVVDICYMHSIEEMEAFVNFVLAYVFYDESYHIRLDISNRYNKSITFYVINDKEELEMPLRKGNGKGVKAVVSFVLLTYYLIRMKSKYLFLDESFVNISSDYVERFFDYVKQLCCQHNMCVVLITHDTRFPEFADKIYQVKQGTVTSVHDEK